MATAHVFGLGGNSIAGERVYGGPGYDPLEVEKNEASVVSVQFSMQNEFIQSFDLLHSTHLPDAPHKWHSQEWHNCTNPVNGAYCPINDAHYFATEFARWFKEQYKLPIYGTNPETTPLKLGVNYGKNIPSAFYDTNGTIYIGDGGQWFHNLAHSDIIAHEMCHAFTSQKQYSKLLYTGQAGGIQEAFSDMCAIVFQVFLTNHTSYTVGENLSKMSSAPMRFIDAPSKDGSSIEFLDDYKPTLDVHFSSGIFNKVHSISFPSYFLTLFLSFSLFDGGPRCFLMIIFPSCVN